MTKRYQFDMERMTINDYQLIQMAIVLLSNPDNLEKTRGMAILVDVMIRTSTEDIGTQPLESLSVAVGDFLKAFTKAYPPERFG